MKGNTIVLASNPKGMFLGGQISGTSKPGTLMQVKATALINDNPVWEPFAPSGGDGKPGLIAVLMEDSNQGALATAAYVDGTQCQVYCPIAGEDVNVRCGEVAGTGNTYAIGDLLMADAEDGLLVPNSSGVSVPFIVMETTTQVAGGSLVWCKYTGH